MRRWLGVAAVIASMAMARPASPSLNARALPSRASVTIKPGEPVSRDVTIANDGDAAVVVKVRLADWALDRSGELELLPPGATTTSLQGFVTYEPEQFSLGPGETGVVHVTLRMPDNGPATRWGLMLSEVRPAIWPKATVGTRAIAQLGTTFYASRIPAERAHGELIGMDVRSSSDTMRVALTMKNPSERHYYAAGRIAVKDSTGKAVAETDLGTAVVLPGMERVFTWTCETLLSPGRYTVTATMDTGEPELIVGETSVVWPARRPARLLAGDDSP